MLEGWYDHHINHLLKKQYSIIKVELGMQLGRSTIAFFLAVKEKIFLANRWNWNMFSCLHQIHVLFSTTNLNEFNIKWQQSWNIVSSLHLKKSAAEKSCLNSEIHQAGLATAVSPNWRVKTEHSVDNPAPILRWNSSYESAANDRGLGQCYCSDLMLISADPSRRDMEISYAGSKRCRRILILAQNPKSKIQNPKSKIQNPKSKIQNPKSKIQNPKSKIQNPKSKIQNPNGAVWGRHKKNED